MSDKYKKRTEGFTLVELSIVIIIIGFLIAGISAGTSLVKQVKLSAVISDFTDYQIVYNNFKSRYNAIPGDMGNGESFWPDCADTIPCNGNDNGIIQWHGSVSVDETVLAMRQLFLAGLITKGGTAIIPANYSDEIILAPWFPESKLGCCLYIAGPTPTYTDTIYPPQPDNISPWAATKENAIFLITAIGFTASGIISPEDSFSIDMKVDDAKASDTGFLGASTGKIRAYGDSNNTCLTGGNYDLASTAKSCILGSQLD
jgi:prepilin-type N-terminal cleavage/methylation domain-containing protein